MSEEQELSAPILQMNERRKSLHFELKNIVFDLVYQLTDETRCVPRNPREATEQALIANRYLSQCQLRIADVCERFSKIDLEEVADLSESLDYYRRNNDPIAF